MPTGVEGIPKQRGLVVEAPERQILEPVDPLPDGSGALVVLPEGVFVSTEAGIRRLFSEPDELERELVMAIEKDDGRFAPRYDMIHAALSPDGRHVACASQDRQHLVLSLDGEPVARFGPVHSEYPDHAAWSGDGSFACFRVATSATVPPSERR